MVEEYVYKHVSISKDETNIIIIDSGKPIYYGSIIREKVIENTTYTITIRGKRDNVTPANGPALKYGINFHYKRNSFNVTLKILDEKNY